MLIDNKLIDNIQIKAEHSDRLRMNFNLHENLEAKAQRLLNVLLPGTQLPIHRHIHTDETYIILRGKMKVIFYDSAKTELNQFVLDPLNGNYGIHIPKGVWHSIEVKEPTTIFEVKDGPYTPLTKENILE